MDSRPLLGGPEDSGDIRELRGRRGPRRKGVSTRVYKNLFRGSATESEEDARRAGGGRRIRTRKRRRGVVQIEEDVTVSGIDRGLLLNIGPETGGVSARGVRGASVLGMDNRALRRQQLEARRKTIHYVFSGKLTLFPTCLFFLCSGIGLLVFHAYQAPTNMSYLHGNWKLPEIPYFAAGMVLILIALFVALVLVRWIVFKISVTFTCDKISVRKKGLFRSSTVHFSTSLCSVHFYRTHYSQKKSWLQLVIKEGDVFYKLFSWKGDGNQKVRFEEFLKQMDAQLSSYHTSAGMGSAAQAQRNKVPTEIISKEEVTISCPFAARLNNAVAEHGLGPFDVVGETADTPLCIDDIDCIDFDQFFSHFSVKKDAVKLRHGMTYSAGSKDRRS